MLAVKAVVKDALIKPFDAIDMPEDEEIVVYAPPKEKGKTDVVFSFLLLLTSGKTNGKICITSICRI